MAQTLTSLLIHVIFSTKHREPVITPESEPALLAYIGGICRSNKSPLLAAGTADDHVHLLVSLSKTIALADLMLQVKRDSSRWAKDHGLERLRWQDCYAGFSVGQSQVPALRRYFARQREKHSTISFKDELLAFLAKYKVDFDPNRLWD